MNGGLQKPTGINFNTPVTDQAKYNGPYREPTWGVDNTKKTLYDNNNNNDKPWYMFGGKSKRRKNKKSGKKSKRKTRK